MPTEREALAARQLAGEPVELRLFWGHTGSGVGPWILSQWYEAPFEVDGVRYRTAEHWMMAEKARIFGDADSLPKILAAPSPAEAKALGRQVTGFLDRTWWHMRSPIVRTGNVEKFRQNPDLCGWLLSTGDAVLVEASPRDRVWGIGLGASNPAAQRVASWRGENLLGFALTEVRRRLRDHPRPQLPVGFVPLPWQHGPGWARNAPEWKSTASTAYLERFHTWWGGLTADERVEVELIHPATGVWADFYDAISPRTG